MSSFQKFITYQEITREGLQLIGPAVERMAEAMAKYPKRYGALAALPMQDPDAAAKELTRCVKELGFKGAMVNGFTQKGVPDSAIYYDIPEYRSFWATVSQLDARYGVEVLSIKTIKNKSEKIKAIPNADYIIRKDDVLIVAGEIRNINILQNVD